MLNTTTIKPLDQVLEDNKKQMAALQNKHRVVANVTKLFPDAVQGLLEDGSTCYFTNSINAQFKNARPRVLREPNGGRTLVRWRVKLGKDTWVYSKNWQALDSAKVGELLTAFLSTPSGLKMFLTPNASSEAH